MCCNKARACGRNNSAKTQTVQFSPECLNAQLVFADTDGGPELGAHGRETSPDDPPPAAGNYIRLNAL